MKKKNLRKKKEIVTGTITILPKIISWYAGYAEDINHARRAVKVVRKCAGILKVKRAAGPCHPIQIEVSLTGGFGKSEDEKSQRYYTGLVHGVLEATK